MRSNIIPTDNEITVKAEIAKNIGGKIWPIIHLSISGIAFKGRDIWFKVLFINFWFKRFNSNFFDLDFNNNPY